MSWAPEGGRRKGFSQAKKKSNNWVRLGDNARTWCHDEDGVSRARARGVRRGLRRCVVVASWTGGTGDGTAKITHPAAMRSNTTTTRPTSLSAIVHLIWRSVAAIGSGVAHRVAWTQPSQPDAACSACQILHGTRIREYANTRVSDKLDKNPGTSVRSTTSHERMHHADEVRVGKKKPPHFSSLDIHPGFLLYYCASRTKYPAGVFPTACSYSCVGVGDILQAPFSELINQHDAMLRTGTRSPTTI